MRSRSAATVVALTAGLTAVLALRSRGERLAAPAGPPVAAPAPVRPLPARDGVVLPFVRPVPTPTASPQPVRPAVPTRCGDTGGRTKAGAPCGARASVAGRCHHHQVAA